MRKLKLISLILIIFTLAIAQNWQQGPSSGFQFTRFDGEYFPATNKVYFMGGRLSAGTTEGSVWEYDPDALTYTDMGLDIETPVSNYDVCLVQDDYNLAEGDTYGLYIIGGRSGTGAMTKVVQVYHPISNTVTTIQSDSFPGNINGTPYVPGACVVYNNKIYVYGGLVTTVSPYVSGATYVYDPLAAAGSRWTLLSDSLPRTRSYILGAVVDSFIYSIGGDTFNGTSLYARNQCWRLNGNDPSTGWQSIANISKENGEARAFGFDANSPYYFANHIIVAGRGTWPSESAHCFIYNVAANSWSTFTALDSARRNHAGAFIPGTAGSDGIPGIWIWGGRFQSDATIRKSAEYFQMFVDVGTGVIINPTPGSTLEPDTIFMPQARIYNYGNFPDTFPATFKIDGPITYYCQKTIEGLNAGASRIVSFDSTLALAAGYYTMSCSTELSGDMNPTNDRQTGDFLVMAAPTLLSPPHLSWITNPTPLFDWEDLAGAAIYEWQLDTMADFSTAIGAFPSNSEWTPPAPLAEKHYYWRVRGINVLNGPWSEVWEFDLDVTAPIAPVLYSPVDNALLNTLTPTFWWGQVTFFGKGKKEDRVTLAPTDNPGITYTLQVADEPTFSSPIINTTIVDDTTYTPSPLPEDTFYWRVMATDGAGNQSPFSTVWSFIIDVTAPLAPTLIAPANGAINVALTPTFEWTAVTFGMKQSEAAPNVELDLPLMQYQIQLSTDPGFGTTVFDWIVFFTTLVSPITLNNSTHYYWHVRAIDDANNTGPYSATFDFTTIGLPTGGWVLMAGIPTAPSGANPKSGSCMAGLEETGEIYFLKASNQPDFYVYTPDPPGLGTWTILDAMPKGDKATNDGKNPKRGAAMAASVPDIYVYVVRGNNTLGFWRYQTDTLDDTILPGWKKMADVPAGFKKPKYGTGLVYVVKGDTDFLFLMKGAKTSEFYLYNIEANSWRAVTSPPVGKSGKSGYKKGSCLTYDIDNDYVYVLQGYYGSFFRYNVLKDSWAELKWYDYKTYVNRDGKKKKPKDGAALAFSEADENVYMLKGGNTQEVWRYLVASDIWEQMNPADLWDIPLTPSNKKVKDGGGMILFDDYFWASKGKNTSDFYRHAEPSTEIAVAPAKPTNQGTMGYKVEAGLFNLSIAPNPAINLTAIRYSLPVAGPATFKLYDVSGTLVKSYANTNPTKEGVFIVDELPAGVYILRFNSGEIRVTRKIVLEK